MRISDWSSDVCSSDLAELRTGIRFAVHGKLSSDRETQRDPLGAVPALADRGRPRRVPGRWHPPPCGPRAQAARRGLADARNTREVVAAPLSLRATGRETGRERGCKYL